MKKKKLLFFLIFKKLLFRSNSAGMSLIAIFTLLNYEMSSHFPKLALVTPIHGTSSISRKIINVSMSLSKRCSTTTINILRTCSRTLKLFQPKDTKLGFLGEKKEQNSSARIKFQNLDKPWNCF